MRADGGGHDGGTPASVAGDDSSIAALIAALAGTAVAVDKITSKDIKRNAVRSKHIKDGQVKPKDADLVKYRSAGVLNTTGIPRVTAGPAITTRAKAGDLLHVQARVTIERTSGTGSCVVGLGVQGGGPDEVAPTDVLMTGTTSPVQMRMTFGQSGTTLRGGAVGRTIPISQADSYRIELSYYGNDVDTNCTFSDRNLWVEQAR